MWLWRAGKFSADLYRVENRMSGPRATYRLQLQPGFGFDQAGATADYLAELGVSHAYCSPYLQAAPGSTHGYDVVDYSRVSAELGGQKAHARMCAAFNDHGLGQVLDIVPNHMAIVSRENPWWWDVLENGPSSKYAGYFDVDWKPPEARLSDTVLMPVLADQYGAVLDKGELKVVRADGNFCISHRDRVFPVAPRSLVPILAEAAELSGSDELAFIADSLEWMPLPTETDRASLRRRHRDKAVLGTMIARLFATRPEVASAVDDVIARLNSSSEELHSLLEAQNYRLAYWRMAERELDYRRFFDINSLVALRVEDEAVFRDTHELVLSWLAKGIVSGVRVDHIDGLRRPAEYLNRLRAEAPGAYLVVEKILIGDEQPRSSWPVDGATGYTFLNRVTGLFVDPAGESALDELYREFTGETADVGAIVREKKHLVMRGTLGSEMNQLTAGFLDICERHPHHRDYTRHEMHEVLLETMACFPVYRTYVDADNEEIESQDADLVAEVVEQAKRNRPDLAPSLFSFLHDVLTLRIRGRAESDFVMRFQQVTGPVMAKAVEDTALYCFNRLVCLNEVGSDPRNFGTSPAEFHRACETAQHQWPRTMLTTSTHDTKRSEDVRARIALLSEIPARWAAAVARWSTRNARYRRGEFPERNMEYLFYQTALGAWTLEPARAVAYMQKAAREAKVHTSWTAQNPVYERALKDFVESVLADHEFAGDLASFVAPLVQPGRTNSLAQTLLKLTAPGVPDIYQGTELWNLSLVDPDNRRPVDYELRRRLLCELRCMPIAEVLRRADEGLPKMWVIRQALGLRARRPEAFGSNSTHVGLAARGARAEHAVAFIRANEVITVVPRLVLKLSDDWRDTMIDLPSGHWHNELTGEELKGGEVALAQLLSSFPVALLAKSGTQ
jgi:(1->4)-alpha-D-glucan 1-alpha-D-glucosylmutase